MAKAQGVSKNVAVAKGTGGAERELLLKELRSVIGKLDAEGLSFLIEQARVHLYNMEVDRLNSEATGIGAAVADKSPLHLEKAEDGSTYHIVQGGKYKLFNDKEMLDMIRLVYGHPVPQEAAKALFYYLKKERLDALNDLDLGDGLAGLEELALLLKKTFKDPAKKRGK